MAAVENWQDNRVTAPAHLRGLNISVIFRGNAQPGVHRISGDDIVLKRPVETIRWGEIEIAVDLVFQKIAQAVVLGRSRAMAYHATDAISRQTTVLEAYLDWVSSIDEIYFEVIGRMFCGEGLLAHRSVAIHAGVDDHLMLFWLVFQVSEFAIQLRIEDRIAPGQSHRRPAPLTVRRDV